MWPLSPHSSIRSRAPLTSIARSLTRCRADAWSKYEFILFNNLMFQPRVDVETWSKAAIKVRDQCSAISARQSVLGNQGLVSAVGSKNLSKMEVTSSGEYLMYFSGFLLKDILRYLAWKSEYCGTTIFMISLRSRSRSFESGTAKNFWIPAKSSNSLLKFANLSWISNRINQSINQLINKSNWIDQINP